jgi:hypothetical protein
LVSVESFLNCGLFVMTIWKLSTVIPDELIKYVSH